MKWITPLVVVMAVFGSGCAAQGVSLERSGQISINSDLIGPAEERMEGEIEIESSLFSSGVNLDIGCRLTASSASGRLAALTELRAEVNGLPESGLREQLNAQLDQIQAALRTIRTAGHTIPIDLLSEQLGIIEDALDDRFVDLIEEGSTLDPIIAARLLILARPLEKRYDSLHYIASKVELYARDEVKGRLSSLLWKAVLDQADGERAAYTSDLDELLSLVDEYRGEMVKAEEADRIRYKADLLLRKVGEAGTTQACDLDLSTAIGGVDLNCELGWVTSDYRAPRRDVDTGELGFGIGYAGQDWGIAMNCQQERRNYIDRLRDDDDRAAHDLDIALFWECGSWETDLSVSFDREYYPNAIDDEIEPGRASQAAVDIASLMEYVRGASLPATLENELLGELGPEGALGALAIGDRRGTVDYLLDFVDDVRDAEWDRSIAPGDARLLVQEALSILPRKRAYDIDIPFSIAFPFHDGDLTIDLEWEGKSYPADSLLDHDTSTREVSYTMDKPTYTIEGRFKREELVYPNALVKDRSLAEWEGEVDTALACGNIMLKIFHQTTEYPHASEKDQSVQKIALQFNSEFSGASVSAEFADELTAHPNDAGKPTYRETAISLSTAWEGAEGAFQLKLSHQTKWAITALSDEEQVKETRHAEFSWYGDIADGMEISASLEWKNAIDRNEPTKDSDELVLKIGFDLTT